MRFSSVYVNIIQCSFIQTKYVGVNTVLGVFPVRRAVRQPWTRRGSVILRYSPSEQHGCAPAAGPWLSVEPPERLTAALCSAAGIIWQAARTRTLPCTKSHWRAEDGRDAERRLLPRRPLGLCAVFQPSTVCLLGSFPKLIQRTGGRVEEKATDRGTRDSVE